MPKHPNFKSFVRASTLSLGSIAFGSLIVTLLEMLRMREFSSLPFKLVPYTNRPYISSTTTVFNVIQQNAAADGNGETPSFFDASPLTLTNASSSFHSHRIHSRLCRWMLHRMHY